MEEQSKIIVAHDIVNDGNDSQQLATMAKKAKETMEVEELNALADGAYYNHQKIKECVDANIIPYVPIPKKKCLTHKNAHFERVDFHYDPETNCYICPAGNILKRKGHENKKGKEMDRYASDAKKCASCTMNKRCLPAKTPYRQICRWEYEEVVEEHKERMVNSGKEQMKKRGALAEHPFGTLKLWLGWTHFLLRGFEKVKSEMDLLVTSYNFKRVLNIIGIDAFHAYCEQRHKTAHSNEKEDVLLYFCSKIAVLLTIFAILWQFRASSIKFTYSP